MRSVLFSLALAVLGCNAPELGAETSSAEAAGGDAGAAGAHPMEAVDACADKASGDACSFAAADGTTVEGTCRSCRDGVLACGSADGGHGGTGGRR